MHIAIEPVPVHPVRVAPPAGHCHALSPPAAGGGRLLRRPGQQVQLAGGALAGRADPATEIVVPGWNPARILVRLAGAPTARPFTAVMTAPPVIPAEAAGLPQTVPSIKRAGADRGDAGRHGQAGVAGVAARGSTAATQAAEPAEAAEAVTETALLLLLLRLGLRVAAELLPMKMPRNGG